ncbi:MAG TPA: hypothetical protein VGH40_22975 [Roseiarcus sp.]|jgi:hypothetical protein
MIGVSVQTISFPLYGSCAEIFDPAEHHAFMLDRQRHALVSIPIVSIRRRL